MTGAVAMLAPLLVLVAGYLLWLGSDEAGGAFQAGAVLGGGAILMALAGLPVGRLFQGRTLRRLVVAGTAVFILVGLVAIVCGGRLLEYPPGWAKASILLIETAATVSIGAIFFALFAGVVSDYREDRQPIRQVEDVS